MNVAFNLIIINLLTLLCSLPLVTIGTSLTAANTVLTSMVEGQEGYPSRQFFQAFPKNLRQGVLSFLVFLLVAFVLGVDLYGSIRLMQGVFRRIFLGDDLPLVSVYGGILHVLNNRLTLILMHTGFSVSMAMFMYHGAIRSNVPIDLEEAAEIDGCSKWRTFWTIVFPLLRPMTATIIIIDAMAFWNDYLLPSLVLGRKNLYTIPVATQVFYGTYSTDIGMVMASLVLAMLPILILYLFLQRFIVAGVTAGAVKG